MPQVKAQADVFRDFDAILGAATQNASLLPGVDPYTTELGGFLSQAKDLKIQQETMEAQRKGLTQKLKGVIKAGRESARKIKAFATIHLGSDNAALSQFGVAVRVGRSFRKKAQGTPPPTQTPNTPPPAQGTAQANPSEPTQGKETTHV